MELRILTFDKNSPDNYIITSLTHYVNIKK